MVGDPDELFYVGICFEPGMGLLRSAESAFHYYEQASKLGASKCERSGGSLQAKYAWKKEADG